MDVGEVVDADDQDVVTGSTNALTYTLSGPDAASFSIDRGLPAANGATGRCGLQAVESLRRPSLDYETKNVYTVRRNGD